MVSFGWTFSNYGTSGCRRENFAGGGENTHYYFWGIGDSHSSIGLPTGYSSFTIEYGQSCYVPNSGVNIKLNGVIISSTDYTCHGQAHVCYVFSPKPACLKTITKQYSPGDVLSIEETGTSIALIKTIKLSPSTQHTLPPCTKAYASTKCAAGTELTEAECRAYAGATLNSGTLQQLIFRSTFSSTTYPSGCWRYSQDAYSVYFVPTDHDGTSSYAAPICKSGCV